MTVKSEIKLVQLGSIGYGYYIDKGFKYISEDTFNRIGCKEIHSGYLLINRLITDKMFVTILPQIKGKIITAVDVCWIAPSKIFNQKFMMYQLMSSQIQAVSMSISSGSTRIRISKGNLIKLAIYLPPLKEQEYIVAKLDIINETLSMA